MPDDNPNPPPPYPGPRPRGRPKGSKNKQKEDPTATTGSSSSSPSTPPSPPKPRGRPRKDSSNSHLDTAPPPAAPAPSPIFSLPTPSTSSSTSTSTTSLPSPPSSSSTSTPPSTHPHTHTPNTGLDLSFHGIKWALGIVVLTLFPRVVGGTFRRLTGSHTHTHTHSPPGSSGPRLAFGQNSKNVWGSIGRFLAAGGAKAAMATAVASMAVGLSVAPPGTFQLYHTVGEIPAVAFREHMSLWGKVVRVSDGDTLRVRHTPIYPLIGNTPDTGRLTEETLIIRLAGIDAPEISKAGAAGQPFSEESKKFVQEKVLQKNVRVKLLSRDQYGRGVCSLFYGGWLWPLPVGVGEKDLSEELVKEGLAVIYRQKGAQYDGKFKKLEALESNAKARKKGLWSKKSVELPHQYKARAKKEEMEKILGPAGA